MASNPLSDLAADLRAAGDALAADLRSNLESAAKPIEQDVQSSLRGGLPSRGGLAAKAARSRVVATGRVIGDGVQVQVETDGTVNLERVDSGVIYHPVHGRGSVSQRVKSGLVSKPLDAALPRFESAAEDAVNAAVDKVV